MKENNSRIFLLEKENIGIYLLKQSIPTMVSMLVSALYNIVDAFFVGRLGTLQTVAVSIIYPLTMVGTGRGLLFGNGASSYISRSFGIKDYERVRVFSSTAILSGLITSSCLVGLMLLFFKPHINVLDVTETVLLL